MWKKISDKAVNCVKCGCPVSETDVTKTVKKPKKKIMIIIISAFVLFVVAIAFVAIFMFSHNKGAKTSKKAAIGFVKAWATNNVEKMIDYSIPGAIYSDAERYVKSDKFANKHKKVDNLEKAYRYCYLVYEGSMYAEINVISADTIKSYNKSDIKKIQNEINNQLKSNIKIQAAEELSIKYEPTYGLGDKEYYMERFRYISIKVRGRWYIVPYKIFDLDYE